MSFPQAPLFLQLTPGRRRRVGKIPPPPLGSPHCRRAGQGPSQSSVYYAGSAAGLASPEGVLWPLCQGHPNREGPGGRGRGNGTCRGSEAGAPLACL